jgi:RNA polymerase sigma-70 factor (ECF subfamily)
MDPEATGITPGRSDLTAVPPEPSDSELASRAQAGEAAAFDALIGRHRPGLVRMACAIVGDADEAESLAQEALTRAFEQLEGFHVELPFGPWLRGITLNLCRNHVRDRARHARPVAPEQLARAVAPGGRRRGALSDVLKREARDLTYCAISQLPFPLREAFVLRYVEGLEYSTISQITGLTPGTLRVRAHRARTLLRDSLGSVVDTWLREGTPGSRST